MDTRIQVFPVNPAGILMLPLTVPFLLFAAKTSSPASSKSPSSLKSIHTRQYSLRERSEKPGVPVKE